MADATGPPQAEAPRPSSTAQQYLEWIYYLQAEGEMVISARLAEKLGVTPPTVHHALRRMIRDGWVRFGDGKRVELTQQGRAAAEEIIRRHRLVERFLTDILGFEWSRAHEQASRLEHAVSAEVAQRLSHFLNDPPTCPHGNPIPGNWTGAGDPMLPLSKLVPGSDLIVRRITEDAEQDPRLLQKLQDAGVVPGERWLLAEITPRGVRLKRDGQWVEVSAEHASWIKVSAAPERPD